MHSLRSLLFTFVWVLATAWGAAQSVPVPYTQATSPAKLAQPVSWGSPHQSYGKRRGITTADRAAIQSYRSGKVPPFYATNFTDPEELPKDWNFVSDDAQWGDFQSCRRPNNVEATSAGLRLKIMVATDCHPKWSTGYIVSKEEVQLRLF